MLGIESADRYLGLNFAAAGSRVIGLRDLGSRVSDPLH